MKEIITITKENLQAMLEWAVIKGMIYEMQPDTDENIKAVKQFACDVFNNDPDLYTVEMKEG